MGIYLNPLNLAFRDLVNSELFVDKTELILYLNTLVEKQQKYISVSRPRRFGKTITANMICAYYEKNNDNDAFDNCKLHDYENWNQYYGKYDVIRLVMTDFFKKDVSVTDALGTLQSRVINELKKAYPNVELYDDSDLAFTMSQILSETGQRFVIVIDEWDAVFRESKNDDDGQTRYLDFLRDWLKDKDYVALAYMTGILPIKKYGKHSALNMFTEHSMIYPRQLAAYTGFTSDEVRKLCEKYEMDFEDISNWYDGYVISDSIPVEKREDYREGKYEGHRISIYSPLSVVEAMTTGEIKNYWNKTENYEALAEYIAGDYDGLKEYVTLLMDGAKLKIDTSTYQNDMTTFTGKDDILSLLIHLGYLGYDDTTSEVYIPNKEILEEFKTSTKGDSWVGLFKALEKSHELLKATWNQDAESVSSLLEEAHDRTANKTYNDEAAFSYSIQYAYYAAQKYYSTILELDSGKGYADIVFLPSPTFSDKPALLIELKYNKDIDAAIAQIKNRNYPERLEHYKGNILLVGINYNKNINDGSNYKHHSCRIEKG